MRFNFNPKKGSKISPIGAVCFVAASTAGLWNNASAQLMNVAVTQTYVDVVGTAVPKAVIPFGTGGTDDDMVAFNSSLFAVFKLDGTLSGSPAPFSVDLRVSINPQTANIGRVMIAQTSDSQGLMDTGTVSVIYQAATGFTGYNYNLALDFQFGSWNNTTSTWTPGNLLYGTQVTTYDLDFGQYIRVNTSDFNQYSLAGMTRLTVTAAGLAPNPAVAAPGSYQIADLGNSDSAFNDARNAVSLLSTGSSDFTLSLGKTTGGGNSLHMFEFRSPPTVTTGFNSFAPIPEPSTYAIWGVGLLGVVVWWRRRKTTSTNC
jgi:hypothetical protein